MPISASRRGFFPSPSALQIFPCFPGLSTRPTTYIPIYSYKESIEWFIEDQAFTPPPPSPISRQQVFSLSQSPLRVAGRAYCQERGRGVGEEPNHLKAGSFINHSILAGHTYTRIYVYAYVATGLQYILNQYKPFRHLYNIPPPHERTSETEIILSLSVFYNYHRLNSVLNIANDYVVSLRRNNKKNQG